MNTALSWLEQCLSTHKCGLDNEPRRLPRRVLQIDGPGRVRLLTTTNEHGKYVCLSHCWGTANFLTTTRSNLAEHEESLALEKLALTFQDAISFTLRLGYRYLWIDSLCIIQDSVEDWREQGSKMADIYEGADVMLSAAANLASKNHLFKSANRHHLSREWLFRDLNGELISLFSREPLSHRGLVENALPLMGRAWYVKSGSTKSVG